MENETTLRIGRLVVTFLDSRFVLRDLDDATQVQMLEDADVTELILFLYRWSRSAQARLNVAVLPDAAPPRGATRKSP